MKLFFILLYLDAATETKTGGFTPEEKTELKDALNDVQLALETKNRTTIEAELKKHADTINASITKFTDWQTQKDEADEKNQKALDEVLVKIKEVQTNASGNRVESKSLQAAMIEALAEPENLKGIESVRRGQRFKMMLKGPINLSMGTQEYSDGSAHMMQKSMEQKTVGNMTAANNLTGQGFVNYNQRQVILPAQKVNARDLIPTVRSETGTYVTFRESAGEGSISRQSAPGAAKTQIDFDFARVEVVSEYIAGFTRYAKQLMRNLPFLQNTLPRLLTREFYKVENSRFWDIMATAYAAGGPTATSTETIDILEIMDTVTQLWDTDYAASYGLLRYTALNRINKWLIQNGAYAGAGGVISSADGAIRVNGTPILPVTFIPSYDKFLTFDRDYVERIEVESLAIEFFEQDDDNVQKNLITARIECFEEFNAMQPAAIIIRDLGNSASS
jgi:small nuclear ribonucleoprotein (snRNP)-like protein